MKQTTVPPSGPNGNGWPSDGFRSPEERHRKRAQSRRRDSLMRSTTFATTLMTALGVGSSTGYVGMELAKDGFSFLDAIVCGAIGCGVFSGISLLWRYGAEVLPEKDRVDRESMVPIYCAGMGAWCAVSIASSAAFLAYPPAAVADLSQQTDYVIQKSAEIEGAHRELYALIPALDTQTITIIQAADLERQVGGICERGPGTGGCETFLRTTAIQTRGTVQSLEASERETAPVLSRMAANREEIRRVLESSDYSYEEKAARVTELRETVATDARTLVSSLNIQSVRALRDAYGADLEEAGLSAIGVQRVSNMLSASKANLDRAVRDTTRASEMVIRESRNRSAFETIFTNITSVWPMTVLSALPEFVTAFLVAFAFATRRKDDDDFSDPDPLAGSANDVIPGRSFGEEADEARIAPIRRSQNN